MKTFKSLFMKNTLTLLFVLALFKLSGQTLSYNSCNDDGKRQYKYSDTFTNYEVQVKGDIEVNDEDTRIVSISPGGYVKISKKTFGNRRSIIIESDSKETLHYEYYEGRSEVPYDPEGKKWLSDILLDVVRITGIDADGRTDRIYGKKGINGFLEEIGQLSSNSVMGMYFSALLTNHQLPEQEIVAVSSAIADELTSNSERGRLFREFSPVFMTNNTTMVAYFKSISELTSNTERGSVLRKISEEIDFNDPKVTEAYFGCVDEMSSNTERGTVLRNVNKTQKLSENAYIRLLKSTQRLSSNTEMGIVLRSLDHLNLENPGISHAYFDAIDQMTSNTEAGITMRALIKNHQLNDQNYARLLKSIKMLSSNTEKRTVLNSIADLNLGNTEVKSAYFEAIDSMSSNTEAGSALRHAISRYEMNRESWVNLLEVTGRLSSNTEMGSVLRNAVDAMPFVRPVIDIFFNAVNHMTSNTESSRVLKKITESPKLDKYATIKIIDAAGKLTSNTEKSNVLRNIADTEFIKDDEVKAAYMDAAKTIASDMEYRRVIEKIIE